MSNVSITLTSEQHRELLTVLTRYTVQRDHWAISPGLKLAITEAKAVKDKCRTCKGAGEVLILPGLGDMTDIHGVCPTCKGDG